MISCDSSSIIALSSNSLLWVLSELNGNFCITKTVKEEIFETPIKKTKHKLEAVRAINAIRRGWLSVKETDEISKKAEEILSLSNNLISKNGDNIKILHLGEAEAIALCVITGEKTLLVDEKVTRLLIEDVHALKKTFEKRLGETIKLNLEVYAKLEGMIKDIQVIRSTEVISVAFERGVFSKTFPDLTSDELKTHVLPGLLHALKSSGCSITNKEIEDIVNIEKI